MTTVENLRARLQVILTELLPANVVTDEMGNTTPANEYRAERCLLLSQEIRRISWSHGVKEQALAVAREADEKAAELTGQMRGNPLPRFESFVSGGHIVAAVK